MALFFELYSLKESDMTVKYKVTFLYINAILNLNM